MTSHTKQAKFSSVSTCQRSQDYQYTAAILFFTVAFFSCWLSYERYIDKSNSVVVARWFLPLMVNLLGFFGAGFWVLGMHNADKCQDSVYIYK